MTDIRTGTGMQRDMGSVPAFIDGVTIEPSIDVEYVAPEIAARDDVATRRRRLASIVEAAVVPRLAILHREAGPARAAALPPVADADIVALARLLMGPDMAAPAAYVTMLRERGVDMDLLFLTLLEPTARFLGTLWERDECDFVDVSLGLARLQSLLAVFNCTHSVPAHDPRRSVLLATMPDDPHFFGVSMVGKFLRAGGWTVVEEMGSSVERLTSLVREGWFAVVGLTVGSDRHLATLPEAIRRIRAASRNRLLGVMVGGQSFTGDPALVRTMGADATAGDAPTAVLLAQRLLDAALLRGRTDERPPRD